jgi:hypothetical protein
LQSVAFFTNLEHNLYFVAFFIQNSRINPLTCANFVQDGVSGYARHTVGTSLKSAISAEMALAANTLFLLAFT